MPKIPSKIPIKNPKIEILGENPVRPQNLGLKWAYNKNFCRPRDLSLISSKIHQFCLSLFVKYLL